MSELGIIVTLAIFVDLALHLFISLHEYKHTEVIKLKCREGSEVEIKELSVGDWIDLESNTKVSYKAGDTVVIDFGVAMELPEGYEAHLLPRSSTFQNTGLLLTNSMGIIDNSYCGDNDYWGAKFYATKSGKIDKGQRLCQFRIMENQPNINFKVVEHLGNKDRGGYGSTGK